MNKIKVSCHILDNNYLLSRDKYVKKCINADNLLLVNDNDYLTVIKDLSNKYHQVFLYKDEYNMERYYTIHTLQGVMKHPIGNITSLGFHSDQEGNPLCKNNDPLNYSDIYNHGANIQETHYATFYDLRTKCHYWWNTKDNEN